MLRLKELRISQNFTQKDLAEKFSTTQTTIGKYERGELEPSIETLQKLANFFECSIDYLVGREDDFGNITIQNENTAPALTDEERRWLEKYRKLDFGNKLSVNGYIDAQLDYQEKHKNWKL